MLRHALACAVLLQASLTLVNSAKQQLQLSDSYLPVAMQVIAHLTDQMAFEVKDEVQPTKGTTRPTSRPTTRPTRPNRPTTPVTAKPYVSFGSFLPFRNGWRMSYGLSFDQTTPFHKPGFYAPHAPPKPSDRISPKSQQRFVLLPLEYTQYTVIEPQEKRTEEPLLSIHEEEVKPLIEPNPQTMPLLPPHFDVDKISSRSDDEDEESLQYLSQNVREMIKMARDPDDDRVIDVWDGVRAGPQDTTSRAKLSSSNLRLLLLYDLLSREAKRQRLSDYSGFSPDVLKTLAESSSGGARAQLRLALSKMVDRHDCEHEYANNRAKEMVAELAKDESKLSSELRYLQPLVYNV